MCFLITLSRIEHISSNYNWRTKVINLFSTYNTLFAETVKVKWIIQAHYSVTRNFHHTRPRTWHCKKYANYEIFKCPAMISSAFHVQQHHYLLFWFSGTVEAFSDLCCEVVFHPSFFAPAEGEFALQVHGGLPRTLQCIAKVRGLAVQHVIINV